MSPSPPAPPPASLPASRPVSALPSARARALAFLAIVVAGACGALIGSAFVGLQCRGDCSGPKGLGAAVGGLTAAGGVAVVAVLTLRAMGEWRQISERPETTENTENAENTVDPRGDITETDVTGTAGV